MKKIIVSNLKHFEEILKNNTIFKAAIENESIIYIEDDSKKYFIFDASKVIYNKIPELGAVRQLYGMKLLECINNNYIPIYDTDGNLIFTKEEFNSIRSKMGGIKKYGVKNYICSDNLYFPELDEYIEKIEINLKQVEEKRKPVITEFIKIMSSIGLTTTIGNNSGGDVELVEAGSTMRGTNVPVSDKSKWDFDFTIRFNPENTWRIKEALETKFNAKGHITKTSTYKVRLTNVTIPGLNEQIDLDFSLTPQKEKYLSSEDSVNEQLENIKSNNYEKYKLVIANIMFAKNYLKKWGVYKPSRGILEGDRSNGGLGGIGIENWILRYGGSFIDAAKDFVAKAENKSFIEYQKEYSIMDFGKNHVSVSKNHFPYDNFVMNNMRYKGFERMVEALTYFLNQHKKIK